MKKDMTFTDNTCTWKVTESLQHKVTGCTGKMCTMKNIKQVRQYSLPRSIPSLCEQSALGDHRGSSVSLLDTKQHSRRIQMVCTHWCSSSLKRYPPQSTPPKREMLSAEGKWKPVCWNGCWLLSWGELLLSEGCRACFTELGACWFLSTHCCWGIFWVSRCAQTPD